MVENSKGKILRVGIQILGQKNVSFYMVLPTEKPASVSTCTLMFHWFCAEELI